MLRKANDILPLGKHSRTSLKHCRCENVLAPSKAQQEFREGMVETRRQLARVEEGDGGAQGGLSQVGQAGQAGWGSARPVQERSVGQVGQACRVEKAEKVRVGQIGQACQAGQARPVGSVRVGQVGRAASVRSVRSIPVPLPQEPDELEGGQAKAPRPGRRGPVQERFNGRSAWVGRLGVGQAKPVRAGSGRPRPVGGQSWRERTPDRRDLTLRTPAAAASRFNPRPDPRTGATP